MELAILSANLKRLRSAAKKSQAEVAEAAGLSRVGYRNIETGNAAPRVETLQRIASVLDVRIDEILAPVRPLHRVRFRAQKRMTSREDLLARVGRQLDDYSELEDLLNVKIPFPLAKLRSRVTVGPSGTARARRAAAAVRKAFDLREDELIRDICGLLESHGVKVLTPKVASEGFFGLSIADEEIGPAVVVNTWERISVERWIFTAAHELGHLLLHLDAYDVGDTAENKSEESEADVFAGYLLMPEAVFDREFEDARGLALVDCVFKLKRIFRVSYRTVLYRIAAKLPTSERAELWRRFQRHYSARTGRTLRRADEPDGLAPDAFHGRPPGRSADEPEKLLEWDFVEDRLFRLVRDAVESDAISLSRAARILDLPLREMRELAASWVG